MNIYLGNHSLRKLNILGIVMQLIAVCLLHILVMVSAIELNPTKHALTQRGDICVKKKICARQAMRPVEEDV